MGVEKNGAEGKYRKTTLDLIEDVFIWIYRNTV